MIIASICGIIVSKDGGVYFLSLLDNPCWLCNTPIAKVVIMTTKITFTVDKTKVYNAILYIMDKGIRHPYIISKVLSKADVIHLNEYGRSIAGDVLLVEQHGTTPKNAKDIIMANWGVGDDFYSFEGQLNIDTLPLLDYLSGGDMAALNEAINIFRDKSVKEAEEINHNEFFWKKVKDAELTEVPVEMMLKDGTDSKFYDFLVNFGPAIVY